MDSKTKIQQVIECLDEQDKRCKARIKRVEEAEKTKAAKKRKTMPTKQWVDLLWL